MNLPIDDYEKDLLIETLEYRVENDEELVLSECKKEELQELVRKIEEGEYE
jgi:hypothetical protein